MPGVAEVAVVAAPDARLGEVGCAFFRMQPDAAPPSLDDVRATLDRAGLARQKWPEHVRTVDEFPRTASGKVQKFVLRQQLREANAVTGLLDGTRVLDAGIWRPVPHATQMLADLGADVFKIEPPGGDPMRTFPQLFRDVAGHKRSIELDLRSDEGRERALELVGRCARVHRRLAARRRGATRPRLRRRARAQPVDHLLLDLGVRAGRPVRRPARSRRQLSGHGGRDRAPR